MAAVYWLASYPKSGNTWLRFMLASYISKEPVLSAKISLLNVLIPVVGGGNANRGGGLPPDRPDPTLVKTHSLPSASLLRPYRSESGKAICLVRNPRDIILSLTNRKSEQRNEAGVARRFIANHGIWPLEADQEWGSWADNVLGWTTPEVVRRYFPDIDVLTVRYEDMRADPAAALEKVLGFLDPGSPVIAEYVAQAVGSTSLENLRALGKKEEEDAAAAGRKANYFRVGQGRNNQSLAALGADVEEEYQRLFQTDTKFSACAKRFGYGC